MMNAYGMGRKMLIVSVLLSMVLLAGCMPVQPVTEVSAQPAAENIETVVNNIWAEYAAANMAGDADRYVALWDENGIQMPAGSSPIEGKENILARKVAGYQKWITNDMTITNQEVEVAGDWAYARGMYHVTQTPASGGDINEIDGKYMSIFRKQADGSWKLYRDISNANVPPAPAAAPTTDVDVVAAAVDAIWREYEASLLDGDADRWIAQWMEDGVQMPPNTLPRVGRETIYKAVSGFLSQFEYTEFAINNEDVEVNGDLAFARGTYAASFVAKSGGDPVSVEGKYMTILRQQSDGSWKIYRDIFNSNLP